MVVSYKSPIYLTHIEGFPYLWSSRDTGLCGGALPADIIEIAGTLMLPTNMEIQHTLDTKGGIEDITEFEVRIVDDTYLLPLLATHRNKLYNIQNLLGRIEAGGDYSTLVFAEAIQDAPSSNGTLYIGNSTITYDTKVGNIHTGCVRGRYADFDEDTWLEKTWKPAVYWSITSQREDDIPVATLYPMTLIGRRITIYKVYEENGVVPSPFITLPEILWRGVIKHYNQAEEGNGIDIQSDNLITLLQGEVFGRQPSVLIEGIMIAGDSDIVDPLDLDGEENTATISIKEEWRNAYTDEVATTVVEQPFTLAGVTAPYHVQLPLINYVVAKIPIGVGITYTIDQIIDKCNEQLKEKYNSGKCYGHYKLIKNSSGNVELHQTPNMYQVWEYDAAQPRSFATMTYDGVYSASHTITAGESFNVLLRKHSSQSVTVVETIDYLDHDRQACHLYYPCASLRTTHLAQALGLCEDYLPVSWIPISLPRRVYLGQALEISGYYGDKSLTDWGALIDYKGSADPDPRYSPYLEDYVYYADAIGGGDGVKNAIIAEDANMAYVDLNTTSYLPINKNSYTDEFVKDIGDSGKGVIRFGDYVVRIEDWDINDNYISLDNNDLNILREKRRKGIIEEKDLVFQVSVADDYQYATQLFQPRGKQGTDNFTFAWSQSGGTHYSWLHMLCSTGTSAYNGVYDRLPVGWGLSIPEWLIDTESFVKYGDEIPQSLLDGIRTIEEPTPLLDILEEESKVLGFNIAIKNGKITLIPNTYSTKNVVGTIDDSVRLENTKPIFESSPDGITNQIKLKYGYDLVEDKFFRESTFVDNVSKMDYNIRKSEEMENKRIPDSCDDLDVFMRTRLYDWSRMPYVYSCDICGNDASTWAVGDTVQVTDANVINPITGTRGIVNHIGYITSITWNEIGSTGTIQVVMPYETTEELAEVVYIDDSAIATWNGGNMDDSFRITKLQGAYIEVDIRDLQVSAKWTPKDGDRLSVAHLEYGLVDFPTVVSVTPIGATAFAMELDRPIVAPSGGYDLYVTPGDYLRQDDEDTANERLTSTFIAKNTGRLSTTKFGARIIR